MASRDMIVSDTGAGSGTVVIPRIRDASAREQSRINSKITGIKRKHRKPFEDRAKMVIAGSKAMSLTKALNENIVTSQIITQMQTAINSNSLVTIKEYAKVIAEHTDISISAIKHYTAELVDNLQGVRKQTTSTLYDMVWKGQDSVVDFINSAVGNATLDETIRANEAIVVSVVEKYIADNLSEGQDISYPDALEAILRMDVNDPKYVELVSAQQRAGELFYFSAWGRSAVTNMNIEIRDAVEDFNGRGMPILPRSNVDQVNVEALSTAHEYATALVRPDSADATDKWVKFMLYLGLSIKMDSEKDFTGVNGAKYYGVPANMKELEENLREGFVESMGQDITKLEQSWRFYTNPSGPKSTGESSIGYLSRINTIMNRLQEDGASEIDMVIDYVRGNKSQVKEMYPRVHWGYAEAFMSAEADYKTAKAATAASAEGGDLRDLQDRAEALHTDIKRVYDEYQSQNPPAAAKESATSTEEERPMELDSKAVSPAAETLGDVEEEPTGRDFTQKKQEKLDEQRRRGSKKRAIIVQNKRTRDNMDQDNEEEDTGFGGGRATKKRRPRRPAKKTRKGKRGKVGRMSRKTRKTTRGRKAKKAKKTRKTRKARR